MCHHGFNRGDFDDYIEPIIDSYFSIYQTETGEVVPLAIPWAMATANALQSFSNYAMTRDKEYFDKYIDRAMRAFDYIRGTRVKNSTDSRVVNGLFPPMASCDDRFVFQSWGNTDTFNLRGLKALRDACLYFGEAERAEEISHEYDDYFGVMLALWDKHKKTETGKTLSVPYSPSTSDEEVRKNFAFGPSYSYFVEALDLPICDAERILKHYTLHGHIHGGLYDRMPDIDNSSGLKSGTLDENGKCLIWYVCTQEYYWFRYFFRHGVLDKCAQIIDSALKYAMTDEYYMFERYHQRNIWFAPWSPNASASGRLILMLLDFYK